MILNFSEYLYFSVINKLYNKVIGSDLKEVSIGEFGIDKIIISYIDDDGIIGRFNSSKSKYCDGGSIIWLEFNIKMINNRIIYHELVHAYGWILNFGREIDSNDMLSMFSLRNYFIGRDEMIRFINIFYMVSSSEVIANWYTFLFDINSGIRLEDCEFYTNWISLNKINIMEEIDFIWDYIDEFISVYNAIGGVRNGEEVLVKINNWDDLIREEFVERLVRLYNDGIRLYGEYINKYVNV